MSAQAVLIVPLTFSLLLLGVHCVQLAHGGHIAVVAATRGAQIAAAGDSSREQMFAAVDAVLGTVESLGSKVSGPPAISVDDRTVQVTVDVVFDGAVPFLPHHVSRTTRVPREIFIGEVDR